MNIEIKGNVHFVGTTVEVTEKFKKREIVVHVPDERNPQYDDYITVQFSNAKTADLDLIRIGDEVKIQSALRGKQYADKKTGEIKYFNSVDGWKIEVTKQAEQKPEPMPEPEPVPETPDATEQDLPF